MGTVLVTGGAGYIGSHACKALKAAGHVPVTFDNLDPTFAVGDRTVTFGCQLETEQYLEFDGAGQAALTGSLG